MKVFIRRPKLRRGAVLFELILAFGFFGIVITGYITALHMTSQTAETATKETAIARVLDSALAEMMSRTRLEEGETTVSLDEFGSYARLEVTTTVIELEMENEKEVALDNMFSIHVLATWFDGNDWRERSAETWRYGRLYQQ